MPVQLSADEFQALVEREFEALPAEMVDGLDNVAVVIEDEAPSGEDPSTGSGQRLLGRYEGVDLTRRGQYGFGELPDRIAVYRLPHLENAADLDALRAEVRTTLVHEIGHYYGLDDDRLHELGWA